MSTHNDTYSLELHLEDDHVWATVPELPGLFVTADTMDELPEALTEAINLYLGTEDIASVRIEPTHVERSVPARLELVAC